MMEMEEIVKIVGPLLGLIILGLMIWKMFQVDDAGKKITAGIQSRKLIIADLFLVGLAFLEGLVAANMGDDTLGDSYTTRFVSHFILSMVGAYAGFICIKEVIDFISKFYESKYSFFYMFFQALQPVIYFVIAGVMPVFNLIIISKGAESYEILSYLWSSDYGFTEVYGALDDVTARSLLMVAVHILLTTAVALGSIDDVKVPKEENKSEKKDKEENKDKKKKKDNTPKTKYDSDNEEPPKPKTDEAIGYMAKSLGQSTINITTKLADVPDQEKRRQLKAKLIEYGWWYKKNEVKMNSAREKLKAYKQAGNTEKVENIERQMTKLKAGAKQTADNFNRLWADIQNEVD